MGKKSFRVGTGERGTKKKPKSVKAKVTSKFSAKRLLSRHGKEKKKGMEGPSTEFVTRTQALKKLQITLKDFRRLCILKGIYPRVPPTKAPKGQDKIYYDIKDLTHLSHEPLLRKFREFKAFMKKIRKASGRTDIQEARRKDELKPQMSLDHLVKERYPRFIDALRDLDDALCMLHLFAALPSQGRITAQHTQTCSELTRHWHYYVAKSHALSKVFVSVKGVYFQAEVMGESVTWLVPHAFTQQIPREVDLRVMLTFLDFYEVFVRFALFKLYSIAGFHYPPVVDRSLDEAGCGLLAMRETAVELTGEAGAAVVRPAIERNAEKNDSSTIHSTSGPSAEMQGRLRTLNQKLNNITEEQEYEEDDEDREEQVPVAALAEAFKGFGEKDAYEGEDEERVFTAANVDETALFRGLRFFLNREVPLGWLQLCIVSNGGQVGWEGQGSPFNAADAGITHHVVDRPLQASALLSGREYVQPQWIFDSINATVLLPVGKYSPGAKLPPHLSPFVDDEKEGYVPKYREEIRAVQAAAGKGGSTSAKPSVASSHKGAEKEKLGDAGSDSDEEAYPSTVRAEKQKSAARKRSRDQEKQHSDDEEEAQEAQATSLETNTKRSKGSKAVVFEAQVKAQTEVSVFSSLGVFSYDLLRVTLRGGLYT
jgi:pescadillo protein